MNKRNKDLLHIFRLLKKLTMTAFFIGINGLKKKPIEGIYFQNLRQIDSNLYIWKTEKQAAIGFRTFYCGATTFVPKEFKKCWISDHHIMSVFYRTGMNSMNIIPHNGELYSIQFRRTHIPWNCDRNAIYEFLSQFILLDGINSWIDLFYSNNDEEIIVNQGFTYPEFKLIDRDILTDMIKIYQMQFGIKKIAAAREKFIKMLERSISSIMFK